MATTLDRPQTAAPPTERQRAAQITDCP